MRISAEFLAQTEHVQDIAEQIRPILAHKGEPVQGAVLATLLSMYLAGVQPIKAKDEATAAAVREARLQSVIACVRKLLPIDVDLVRKAAGLFDEGMH